MESKRSIICKYCGVRVPNEYIHKHNIKKKHIKISICKYCGVEVPTIYIQNHHFKYHTKIH